MADFSQFKQAEIDASKTVDYPFYTLADTPTLVVAPAGEINKPFFRAQLKRARKNQRMLTSNIAMSEEYIAEVREEDKGLYALHIVKGWSSVLDAGGEEIPFTRENVREFLDAIPIRMFDQLRVFCGELDNFMDEGVSEAPERGKS